MIQHNITWRLLKVFCIVATLAISNVDNLKSKTAPTTSLEAQTQEKHYKAIVVLPSLKELS